MALLLTVAAAAIVLTIAAPHPGILPLYPYPFAATAVRSAVEKTVRIEARDTRGYPLGCGTGVIVDADVVVTCFHVVEGAAYIVAKTGDGSIYPVRAIIDSLVAEDLVLLRTRWIGRDIATIRRWPLDDYNSVFALGYSKYARDDDPDIAWGEVTDANAAGDRFEYDARIFPGFSGGGVFSEAGELLGINAEGGVNAGFRSYAVPAETVDRLLHRPRDADARKFPPLEDWPTFSGFLASDSILSAPELGIVIRALAPELTPSSGLADAYRRVAEEPLDLDAHRSLLLHFLIRDEMTRADAELEILESLQKDEPFAILATAIVCATHEEFESAVAVLEGYHGDAGKLAPFVSLTAGLLYIHTEQPDKAIRAYKELTRTRPDLAQELFKRLYPGAGDALRDELEARAFTGAEEPSQPLTAEGSRR